MEDFDQIIHEWNSLYSPNIILSEPLNKGKNFAPFEFITNKEIPKNSLLVFKPYIAAIVTQHPYCVGDKLWNVTCVFKNKESLFRFSKYDGFMVITPEFIKNTSVLDLLKNV